MTDYPPAGREMDALIDRRVFERDPTPRRYSTDGTAVVTLATTMRDRGHDLISHYRRIVGLLPSTMNFSLRPYETCLAALAALDDSARDA